MSPFQWFDDPNLSLAISYFFCYMNALHLLASNGQPPAVRSISEWIDQWENKQSPAANL